MTTTTSSRQLSTTTILLLAVALTLVQLAFACSHSAQPGSPLTRYLSLAQWDSLWYRTIAIEGYHSTIPPKPQNTTLANVAFFPGYPLAARVIYVLFNTTPAIALLLAAQLACVGTWTYFLLLCRRWKWPLSATIGGVTAIAAYPGAFFLVVGYSESLFTMALLGSIYWSQDERKWSWLLAGLHGCVLSATRLVGLPLCIIPLLFRGKKSRSQFFAATVLSALGGIAFFVYCQWVFGHWNLYFWTQEVGWKSSMNLDSFFQMQLYTRPSWPLNSHTIGSFAFRFLGGTLIAATALTSLQPHRGRHNHWALLFCSLIMFMISVAGSANRELTGMFRYGLPISLLLVSVIAMNLTQLPLRDIRLKVVLFSFFILLLGAGFWLQGDLIQAFTARKFFGIA